MIQLFFLFEKFRAQRNGFIFHCIELLLNFNALLHG